MGRAISEYEHLESVITPEKLPESSWGNEAKTFEKLKYIISQNHELTIANSMLSSEIERMMEILALEITKQRKIELPYKTPSGISLRRPE
jgi:hypothetical protein